MRNQVFFSYCQQDKQWLDEIQNFLHPLLQQQPLLLWDETKILAGKDWLKEINHALSSAKVAVLLVSPDYLASDFIAKQILPPLLDAAENDGLTILWIAIRKCFYEETEIERYKPVNEPSKPLATLKGSKRDDALANICRQIALAANQEPEKPVGTLVVNVETAGITIKGEPIASRARIQQIIEEYFDVNACFIRQREIEDLFKSVLHGTRRIIQGANGAGKTTLLKQLQKRCQEKKIPARYVDFSRADEQLQTTLWRNVVLVLTNVDPGIISPNEIDQYLDSEPLEPRAVICLDNIDALAGNLQISIEQEMVHLRSLIDGLGTHHKSALTVILTIHDDFDVRKYASRFTSPWYTMFLTLPLAELSQQRSMRLLHLAGITDVTQVAFCVNKAMYRLPLDILLLAYLLKEPTTPGPIDYELIEKMYLQVEPLLRRSGMNAAPS
jgi:TIR domain